MANILRMLSRLRQIRREASGVSRASYQLTLQLRWANFCGAVIHRFVLRRLSSIRCALATNGYVYHCETTLKDEEGNIVKCRVTKVRRRLLE